jgi:hypothetical protein
MSTQNLKNSNELENKIRTLVGHDQVVVSPYRGHFLIQVLVDNTPETIARLSEIRPNLYGAAFQTHKGLWEPLPGEGNLLDMAELVVDMLRPHLDVHNF